MIDRLGLSVFISVRKAIGSVVSRSFRSTQSLTGVRILSENGTTTMRQNRFPLRIGLLFIVHSI
ncbi:MAG: hypothetical protein RLZZ543_1414 [Bacteroidota bacterium]|jgi:hypothetical protein